MSRFSARWLEIAIEQYLALPPAIREQIDVRIEELLEHPEDPAGGYDDRSDQWTTTYGDGAGLILYAVSSRNIIVS